MKSKIQRKSRVVVVVTIISIVVLFLFLVTNIGKDKQRLQDQSPNELSTYKVESQITQTHCPENITPPKNYRNQEPINSFYGWGEAGIACYVFLGPNYKAGYEGFAGEQIQVNAYLAAETSEEDLVNRIIGTQLSEPIETIKHYRRDSYGGKDEFVIIQKEDKLYEIIWREEQNQKSMRKAVLEIVEQLE